MKCSICDKAIPVKEGGWSEGNNAQPINDGRCCDECNANVVIPARLHAVSNRHEEEEEEHWLYLLNYNGYERVVGEDDKWTTAHQMTGETGRLFAAAPELLAACKAMLACSGLMGHYPEVWSAVRQMREAVAKIEGAVI
jgi:hypothetical protein